MNGGDQNDQIDMAARTELKLSEDLRQWRDHVDAWVEMLTELSMQPALMKLHLYNAIANSTQSAQQYGRPYQGSHSDRNHSHVRYDDQDDRRRAHYTNDRHWRNEDRNYSNYRDRSRVDHRSDRRDRSRSPFDDRLDRFLDTFEKMAQKFSKND